MSDRERTILVLTEQEDTMIHHLSIAAGANVAGMAMALTMPRRGWRERG